MSIEATPEKLNILVVAAALIDRSGRFLVQRRPSGKQHGGLWEFPGGKVEPGEAPAAALARELREELQITVSPDAMAPLSFTTESAARRHLTLLLYIVRAWRGDPIATEADEMRWVSSESVRDLPMPPADLPLVEVLVDKLANQQSM